MAARGSIENLGFVLDSTLFLDAWGRRFAEEEGEALSFLRGSMFTTDLIEQELSRRPNWDNKHRVLGLLGSLIHVMRPSETTLGRLAHGQNTRLADWSLVALAEELSDRKEAYVVSNDTTVAADVTRSSKAYDFLDDESFLRLVLSLADSIGLPTGRIVTIYGRVRDSIINRAAVDQDWYRELSTLNARSEIRINRILESNRRRALRSPARHLLPLETLGPAEVEREETLPSALPPAPPAQTRISRASIRPRGTEKYNVTYSGNPRRGAERGIIMLGTPGSSHRDRLPSGWVRLRANGLDYWGKFAKIALNVVREKRTDARSEPNLLDGILRSWFGKEGILPGDPVCHVTFRESGAGGEKVWEMLPIGPTKIAAYLSNGSL
jgi:hypothetical protein